MQDFWTNIRSHFLAGESKQFTEHSWKKQCFFLITLYINGSYEAGGVAKYWGGGIPEHAVHHGKNLCAVCTWGHPCCGPGAAAWPCCWSGSRGRCTPSSTGPPLRTLLGSTGYMYSNKLYFFIVSFTCSSLFIPAPMCVYLFNWSKIYRLDHIPCLMNLL